MTTRKPPRIWTEADDAYLLAHYESTPTLEIAQALGRRHSTIKVHADKLGLLSAKRQARAVVRHDYFASINSHTKAYVLGLMAADGWVSTERNEIGLSLHSKDEALVVLVRDELAPLHRIYHPGDRSDFRLSSAQVKADLARFGVTPNKSLTLQWPILLAEELAGSFMLGCYDGDGSLYYEATRRYYHWSLLSASRGFLEAAQSRILTHAGVKVRGPYRVNRSSSALRIEYVGPKTYLIDEWLHAAVPGLARKRQTTPAESQPHSAGS